MRGKIVIIGAGITGLTAARIIQDNQYSDFMVYEKNNFPGGLTTSYLDLKGFTWDSGGHVFYNKNSFADSFTDRYVKEWKKHIRRSCVVSSDYVTKYPFQHHLYELEKDINRKCYVSWLQRKHDFQDDCNLEEWSRANYGDEIHNLFIKPYNGKIWHPFYKDLSYRWAQKSLPNINDHSFTREEGKFGLNYQFRYPLHGGAQRLSINIADSLPGKIHYNAKVIEIDPWKREVKFSNGSCVKFDYLISTIPLDELFASLVGIPENLLNKSKMLKSISILLTGAGVKNKKLSESFSWNYYPDKDFIPYRISNLSLYSPNNTPGKEFRSLMSESIIDPVTSNPDRTSENIIEQMLERNFFCEKDLVSTFVKVIDKAYPVPLQNREKILHDLFPYLEQLNIFSRGRNGCWRYETGGIPDCINIGREIAERILFLKEESIVVREY